MSAYCPIHGTELDGGPVTYTCRFGHGVKAADITHEITTESGRPRL